MPTDDFWFHVGTIIAGLWMALLQWLGIRTIRRVDRLESDAVTKADIRELKDEFRESRIDVRDQHQKLGEKLDRLTGQLSDTNERLARMEGGRQ